MRIPRIFALLKKQRKTPYEKIQFTNKRYPFAFPCNIVLQQRGRKATSKKCDLPDW